MSSMGSREHPLPPQLQPMLEAQSPLFQHVKQPFSQSENSLDTTLCSQQVHYRQVSLLLGLPQVLIKGCIPLLRELVENFTRAT